MGVLNVIKEEVSAALMEVESFVALMDAIKVSSDMVSAAGMVALVIAALSTANAEIEDPVVQEFVKDIKRNDLLDLRMPHNQ